MNLDIEERTPRGSGAVSVLRVRGPDAAAWIRALCGGSRPESSSPRRVDLRVGGEDLDEAIVCALPSGEFELHVHGSPVLVRGLLARFGPEPTSATRPRSIEESAAEALASAPCEAAARILLDQAEGALSRELNALEADSREARERRIDALLSRWSVARRALEPAELVLVGAVNTGKSTLFNALLGESRAIVDPEPGTTRDRLRARAQLGAWPVWISDTAGERALLDAGVAAHVEREGQDRARRAAAAADLVVRLERLDAGRGRVSDRAPVGSSGEVPEVVVPTFADLVAPGLRSEAALSARTDPEGARRRMADVFRSFFSLPAEPWTPGAGVPWSAEQASGISSLRGRNGIDLQRAVKDLMDRGGDRCVAAVQRIS